MKKALLILIIIVLCCACNNQMTVDLTFKQNEQCNLANRGLMAQNGDDIWFNDIYENPPVIKQYNIKTGEMLKLFNANATYLTPLENKVYFLNASDKMSLYVYDTLNMKTQKLYGSFLTGLTEYCGNLYFVENNSIMSLRSGNQVESIYNVSNSDDMLGNLWPTKQGIYFLITDSTNHAQLLFIKGFSASMKPELILQSYGITKFYLYNSDFILINEEHLYLYCTSDGSCEKLLDFPVSMDSVCICEDNLFCSSNNNSYILNLESRELNTLTHTKFSAYVIGNLFCSYMDDQMIGFDADGNSYNIF